MISLRLFVYFCLTRLFPDQGVFLVHASEASKGISSQPNSSVPQATYLATSIFTVDEGTLLFDAAEGTSYSVVTLVGPTTATVVASQTAQPPDASAAAQAAPWINHDDPFVAYSNPADPACNATHGAFSFMTSATVVRKSPILTLTAGQTVTTRINEGYLGETLINETYTGPGTIYQTVTDALFQGDIGSPTFQNVIRPAGERCGGFCGSCGIYFDLVHVYYWPVASANTGCLSASNATATAMTAVNTFGKGVIVRPRGLSQLTGETTLVNSDGFTFTSPSVYVAFPTIYAADQCGYIGSVHTSVTRAFAPDQLSTAVVFNDSNTAYLSFNYADAQCPPVSLSTINAWTVLGHGETYNPIISPPAGLTLIDPNWNQLCSAAPFQGNDPPYALVSEPSLPPITVPPSDPSPIVTPASPGPSILTLPQPTQSSEDPRPTASRTIVTLSLSSKDSGLVPVLQTNSPQSLDHSANPSPQDSQIVRTSKDTTSLIDPAVQSTADPGRPEASAFSTTSQSSVVQITFEDQTYVAGSMSDFLIAGQTLTPNGIITALETTLSLAADASFVVIAGTTIPLENSPQSLSPIVPITGLADVLTFAGLPYTANPSSVFEIDGQTLAPGGAAITISGTRLSLNTIPTAAVIGSSTEGLGAIIMSGFGTGDGGAVTSSTATASIMLFEGSAIRVRSSRLWGKFGEEGWLRAWELGLVLGMVGWML